MTLFFNQMLGCLIIAAGIGGVVGWFLKHVSADKSAQQLADVTAMMHLKEQMLEKARQQLRGEATSTLPPGESELTASQSLSHSNQEASHRKSRLQDQNITATIPIDFTRDCRNRKRQGDGLSG